MTKRTAHFGLITAIIDDQDRTIQLEAGEASPSEWLDTTGALQDMEAWAKQSLSDELEAGYTLRRDR